jgi:hypothetical protein
MAQRRYPSRRLPTPPPPSHIRSGTSHRYTTPTTYGRNIPYGYFGLRLGLNVATVNSTDRYLDGGKTLSGVNIGAVGGFQVAPATPLFFETGLLYSEKGGKGNADGHSFTYSLNYLEMPLVMKYSIDLDRYFSIQPFGGVYGAVGISGKMKDFGSRRSYSAFDDEGFRRLDAGLRLGCGVQIGMLYGELGYDVGLANISRDYFDSAHTGCFFATAGLNF